MRLDLGQFGGIGAYAETQGGELADQVFEQVSKEASFFPNQRELLERRLNELKDRQLKAEIKREKNVPRRVFKKLRLMGRKLLRLAPGVKI